MVVVKSLFGLTSNLCKRISGRTGSFNKIRSMSSAEGSDVLLEEVKNVGILILNRPKSLNALDVSMMEKIYPALKKWQNEKKFVIVKGAGEKAFCAGGDVRALVVAVLKGDTSLGKQFFKKEYINNGLIGSYKIPYVALIDGIVMGGGVGMSVHGRYRVATERTVFAMPETQIGLFPDVGGSYFLPRLQGRLGLYLALTGYRLTGADVMKAGIATHYCESAKLGQLEQSLINECHSDQDIQKVLEKYNAKIEKDFCLSPHLEKINTCFAVNSIEELLKNLEKDGSEWALSQLKILKNMSPTSLKVTLKELELGGKLNLNECLQMEYRIAVNCLENHDFPEGVRALLIDKDKNPKWKPAVLSEVTNEFINSHFSKLSEEEELRHKL